MPLKTLQTLITKNKLDGLLLHWRDPTFIWLIQERRDACLFIPKKGKPLLFQSPLSNYKGNFKTITLKNKNTIKNHLKNKKLGINGDYLTLTQANKIKKFAKTKNLSKPLSTIRAIKTTKELQIIKKLAKTTDTILKKLIKNFKFKHEKEIQLFLKTEIAKHQAIPSFDPIVASGKSAAIPHYTGSKPLRRGFLIIDFGIKKSGYCTDITRTFFIGTPTQKEKELYTVVLNAQKTGIQHATPGTHANQLDKIVRTQLGSLEKLFTHATGHGLGIKVHEYPPISSKSRAILKQNMVITIEPGIYNPQKGYGIRIEDDIIIKKSPEILSKTPKRLLAFNI